MTFDITFFASGTKRLGEFASQIDGCNGIVVAVNHDTASIRVSTTKVKEFGAAFRKTQAFLWSDFNADGASRALVHGSL